MPLNRLGLKSILSPPPFNYSAQRSNQPPSGFESAARIWAAEELRAAMAHELNDPLTALLFYLHGIKEAENTSADTAMAPNVGPKLISMALSEAEHICAIVERIGHAFDAPVEVRAAVARGRDAIDSWTRNSHAEDTDCALPGSSQDALTPREREVLGLIVGGDSNKEGAYRLGIATRTFEVHRAHIMEKLGAKNAADLVRMALSEGR